MSLRLLFVINREIIDEVVVTRIGQFEGLSEVHRYEVVYEGVLIGHMDHLYSDGALILAQKALTLVKESLP